MSTHSRLSASGAERWMNCPRSPAMQEGYPDIPSASAQQGTAAHWVGEQCLRYDTPAEHYLGMMVLVDEGTRYAKRIEVDEDMTFAAQMYADTVIADCYGRAVVSEVEQQAAMPWIHPDVGGTSDCRVRIPAERLIRVYDFKYGYKPVAVEWNPQLMMYGLAALHGHSQDIDTVELVVIQPRSDDEDIKRWRIQSRELIQWGVEVLRPCAHATDNAAARICAGDHCTFCRAKVNCPAFRRNLNELAQSDFENPMLPAKEMLSPERIEKMIDAIGALERFAKDVYNYAQSQVEAGRLILPNKKLVRSLGNRRWNDPERAKQLLSYYLGDKAFTTPKLISPAAAEKLLTGTVPNPKGILSGVTERPDNGLALVSREDKRPEESPLYCSEFIANASVFA